MPALPPIIAVMQKAAESAARTLVRDFGEVENLQVSRKGPSDFVTAADKRAESSIHFVLSKAYPSASFLMEESGVVEGTGDGASRKFIIDPLDGTNNFLHGIPHWAISIAQEENGVINAGLILDPLRDEMFWAVRGGGAFNKNRRLRVSSRNDLELATLSTGMPSKGRGDMDRFEHDARKACAAVGGVRRFGSATLDLSYVAAGRLEGYWEHQLAPWDMAAGLLIVSEAGGKVTGTRGEEDPMKAGSILATNGVLYQDIFAMLN